MVKVPVAVLVGKGVLRGGRSVADGPGVGFDVGGKQGCCIARNFQPPLTIRDDGVKVLVGLCVGVIFGLKGVSVAVGGTRVFVAVGGGSDVFVGVGGNNVFVAVGKATGVFVAVDLGGSGVNVAVFGGRVGVSVQNGN